MSVTSRGLHSAVFSLIGAIGFLASAVLPADAYLVSPLSLSSHILQNANMTSSTATAASSSQPAAPSPASPLS